MKKALLISVIVALASITCGWIVRDDGSVVIFSAGGTGPGLYAQSYHYGSPGLAPPKPCMGSMSEEDYESLLRRVIREEIVRAIETYSGYDQDLWAERLGYDEADADQALEDFGLLRRANLRLLACASDEDLRRVGIHAERGAESVGHMIRLYAGHDLLHLEQLARIRRAVTQSA